MIKVQARLEANAAKLWSLNEWSKTGGEPDVVDYDKKGNIFSMIVHGKAPKAAEAFVTTGMPGMQEKNLKPSDSVIDMAYRNGH